MDTCHGLVPLLSSCSPRTGSTRPTGTPPLQGQSAWPGLFWTHFSCACVKTRTIRDTHVRRAGTIRAALTRVPSHSGHTTKTCRMGSRGLRGLFATITPYHTPKRLHTRSSGYHGELCPANQASSLETNELVEHCANSTRLRARPKKRGSIPAGGLPHDANRAST